MADAPNILVTSRQIWGHMVENFDRLPSGRPSFVCIRSVNSEKDTLFPRCHSFYCTQLSDEDSWSLLWEGPKAFVAPQVSRYYVLTSPPPSPRWEQVVQLCIVYQVNSINWLRGKEQIKFAHCLSLLMSNIWGFLLLALFLASFLSSVVSVLTKTPSSHDKFGIYISLSWMEGRADRHPHPAVQLHLEPNLGSTLEQKTLPVSGWANGTGQKFIIRIWRKTQGLAWIEYPDRSYFTHPSGPGQSRLKRNSGRRLL